MQAKRKRLESLTKTYMKGSQHKLEQLWSNYHGQRWVQEVLQDLNVKTTSSQRQTEGKSDVLDAFVQEEDDSAVFSAGVLGAAAVGD